MHKNKAAVSEDYGNISKNNETRTAKRRREEENASEIGGQTRERKGISASFSFDQPIY